MTSLPSVTTPHADGEVLSRLDRAARRGRLAGFTQREGDDLFGASAFGDSLDYRLLAASRPNGQGNKLSFRLKMMPKTPIIFVVVTLLTIWPGVWLTDSMMRTYFTGYDFQTWIWYLPLTILPVPWMWGRMKSRSRAAALEHALEQIDKIAKEIDGEVVRTEPAPDQGVKA